MRKQLSNNVPESHKQDRLAPQAQIRELLPSDPSPPPSHHPWLPPLCSFHSSVSAKGSESLLGVELSAPWPTSSSPSASSSAGKKRLLMPEGLFLRR